MDPSNYPWHGPERIGYFEDESEQEIPDEPPPILPYGMLERWYEDKEIEHRREVAFQKELFPLVGDTQRGGLMLTGLFFLFGNTISFL
jgi:hypothetical protein